MLRYDILTGPTQLRTITACLHMDTSESGSATSATMISTSDLSSGLPACEHTHTQKHSAFLAITE